MTTTTQNETTIKGYTIQFCEPGRDAWRQVTARPHSERHGFHNVTKAIWFANGPDATDACESYDKANDASFRVIGIYQLSDAEKSRWFPNTDITK